ncbi:ABC transporter substrate-binding protein [Granulosicoccus antarcticus]|uniref:Heme-binding protein A n=1 Tax=Granulosicoccus antarcticus IMCC3135 TaxID=1192854 RepID=A0A2Z2NRT7_9GAMM|nr:ABC transporter substrate-binding protein [Granulosicoccus antarcticus]ASJ74236.1 Heme-binding protein A [Granulosicoccus antarcticus IMCC3135]
MSMSLEQLGKLVVAGKLDRRTFMKRAAAMGAGVALSNGLLSQAALAQEPVSGGLLKLGSAGGESTNSLDPATASSSVPFINGHQWGDVLLDIADNGGIENRLAEEYGSSADAKTWTFKIRKGVEFHNGKTLTPADVLATLERHSGEDTKSGALGVMRGIETMKVDGDTVVIGLKDANADLPFLMTDYHLMIQPNGGKDDPAAGIGTGPYKMVVNEPGVRHGYEKNQNDWKSDRGFADQVEILVINDDTARVAALQSGQVHMIERVPPKIVELVKRIPNVDIKSAPGRGHYVFIMHTNTAPFDNNDLRLALKYAIDRQEMVDKILFGYGSIGNDMPVNQAYPYFSDDIEQRSYDPDKAAFHFKKSGHEGPVVLRTADGSFPGAVDASQLFQQSCAKAGITLDVKREPNDGYWSEVWNKQPFCTSYWGGRPTQDQMYSTAYLSSADWNDTRFFNDDFDKMLLTARGELDDAKRKQIYRDMGTIVHNEGGLICPMFNDWVEGVSTNVGGWAVNSNQTMMNGQALSRCWLKS